MNIAMNRLRQCLLYQHNLNLKNLYRRSFSRIVARGGRTRKFQVNNFIRAMSSGFRITDYDCVGFDLDNTLLRYKVGNMIRMEYDTLAEYLIKKGYSKTHLMQPIDVDFLQKGLILDFHRGNVVKIDCEGTIEQASHGTKKLSEKDIVDEYGPTREWNITREYSKNMLCAWNGPLADRLRTTLDYFDMPASLIFARIVDSLDEKNGSRHEAYNVWPDILSGLVDMYNRDHFENNRGGYFLKLKADPSHFMHKTSDHVLNWLKEIKSTKTTFLLTGSHADFANFTASYALGVNWRDYFDFIVCYAKKPGFFVGHRPFVRLNGTKEVGPVERDDLKLHECYTQGNWEDLKVLLSNKISNPDAKFIYMGDNLIQDIYTPKSVGDCDTIAVVEEMCAEGMVNCDDIHPDMDVLNSNFWGSYFISGPNSGSIWSEVIKQYSKICVPSLDVISKLPIDFEYKTFKDNAGYYPNTPVHLP